MSLNGMKDLRQIKVFLNIPLNGLKDLRQIKVFLKNDKNLIPD